MKTGRSDSIFGKDITEYGYINNRIVTSDRGYEVRGVTGQVTHISDLDLPTRCLRQQESSAQPETVYALFARKILQTFIIQHAAVQTKLTSIKNRTEIIYIYRYIQISARTYIIESSTEELGQFRRQGTPKIRSVQRLMNIKGQHQ